VGNSSEVERNELHTQQWLDVWRDLQRATAWHENDNLDEAVGWIIDAMNSLYLLSEPASVRELRLRARELQLREDEGKSA